MLKHKSQRSRIVYVGFVDYRPHVQLDRGSGGPRVIACYTSRAAAKRSYADVRKARLVFDADWRAETE